MALIATLSWLMPWYVIWVLPLAALGTSVRLRRVSLALTLFLVSRSCPATQIFMGDHNINPLDTSAGQASSQLAAEALALTGCVHKPPFTRRLLASC